METPKSHSCHSLRTFSDVVQVQRVSSHLTRRVLSIYHQKNYSLQLKSQSVLVVHLHFRYLHLQYGFPDFQMILLNLVDAMCMVTGCTPISLIWDP